MKVEIKIFPDPSISMQPDPKVMSLELVMDQEQVSKLNKLIARVIKENADEKVWGEEHSLYPMTPQQPPIVAASPFQVATRYSNNTK